MAKPRSQTYGLGRIYRKETGGVPYGSWYVQYCARGVVHRENARSQDEQVALRLLKQRLGEVAAGRPLARGPGRVLVADLLADLAARYALEQRPSARNLPAHRVAWLEALGPDCRAAEVTTARLDAIATRWRREVAPATVNRRMEVLRRAYRLGASVTPPTVAHVPAFPPKLEEDNVREGFVADDLFLGPFLAHVEAHDPPLRDYLEWVFWTGMRTGAVKDLEWTAVDRDRWQLSLLRGRRRNKGKPKWLPLEGPLRAILERAWARRIAHAQATGRAVPWIFWRVYDGHPRPGLVAGDPVTIVDFRKAWKSAAAAAGCPGFTPHDLRRMACRRLWKQTGSEAVCMAITGHKTPSMFRRYNITENADLGAALARTFVATGATPPARRGRRLGGGEPR